MDRPWRFRRTKTRALIALLIGLGFFVTAPAQADQVHFQGQTTANATLIKDTLQNILTFAHASKNCRTITAVDATILPPDYLPENPKYRVGVDPVTYEAWSATLCGETVKFLISFWSSVEGGTMFSIGFPYPADAP